MRIRARVPASIRDGRNADQVDLAGDAGSELGLRWIEPISATASSNAGF